MSFFSFLLPCLRQEQQHQRHGKKKERRLETVIAGFFLSYSIARGFPLDLTVYGALTKTPFPDAALLLRFSP